MVTDVAIMDVCVSCLDDRTPTVEKVFMFRRTGSDVNFVEGRDIRMEELLPLYRPYCPSEVCTCVTYPTYITRRG